DNIDPIETQVGLKNGDISLEVIREV
ncbi:MAG: hypothetical protein PWR12_1025, partial [Eubacteriaceae bacterium]|nr:hypothetical protein [Eubacteriaceae bacterium]